MTKFRFSRTGRMPRKLLALFTAGVMSISVVAGTAATNISGFEIDADNAPANASSGYYSGNDTPPGDDWVDGGPNNGVFELGTAGNPDFLDCYGSNISVSTGTAGAATLICDGTSNSTFNKIEPEQNIVSPSGKTPDDKWPIKPGNNTPKNDITHGYVSLLTTDSVCDTDTLADDLIVRVAGERLNNEGDSFWGFEFDKIAPTGFSSLVNNDGSSFTLDFNRSLGDVLMSVSLQRGGTVPTIEVYVVTGFNADGSAIFTGPQASQCSGGGGVITSQGVTNGAADLLAPPWNVLVCDPSSTNSTNSCRLVNKTGTGTVAGDTNIPPRDFIEAAIDLTQFGIAAGCFNNVLFTSRSSSSISADLKDVGGGIVPLCAVSVATQIHAGTDHATDIQGTTVDPGTVVHDKAIVAGTISGGVGPIPTGTVDFARYTNNSCTGTPAATENNITLGADGTIESTSFTTVAGQGLSYKVHYDGNSNYSPSDGPCEILNVKNIPTVTTQVHNAAHTDITNTTVDPLTVVHDKAIVTGPTGAPTPSGTVDFARYTTIDCTGASTDQNNVTLGADGTIESSTFTTVAGQPLSYKVHYDGDLNYVAGDGICEPLNVRDVPVVTTEIHGTAHTDIQGTTVNPGTVIHDKAIVTGTAGHPVPTGTVDFVRYATNDCTGASVAQNNVTLGTDGTVESNTFTTIAGQGVSYKVHYDGDLNYVAGDGPCEPLNTKFVPNVATQVHNPAHTDITNTVVTTGLVVHDKAIVTGPTGAPVPGGTVDFVLYNTNDCTGTPESTQNNVTLGADGTVESNTFTATEGFHGYLVHYDGDANYIAGDGICEPFRAVNPSTLLTKTATVSTTATYAYTETNDGSSPLTNVFVSDPTCQAAAIRVTGDTDSDGILDAGETWSGDTDGDGILDPGETWNFTCTKTFNGPGTFTNVATGHATDPVGRDVTFCDTVPTPTPTLVFCDQQERDSVTVGVTVTEAAGP